jgi:hypothetical protein
MFLRKTLMSTANSKFKESKRLPTPRKALRKSVARPQLMKRLRS